VIYVGPPNYFSSYDQSGACTATDELVLPLINIKNGYQWECISSLWVRVRRGQDASQIVFEGATDNGIETILAVTDPTSSDKTVTLPNQTGAVIVSPGGVVDAANAVSGVSNGFQFEGATADAFETTLSVTDPTADRTITLPDAGGMAVVSSLATNAFDAANSVNLKSNGIEFEGATADAFEGTLSPADVTADRTWTLPNATGTVSIAIDAPCASASSSCTETVTAGVKVIAGISGALNGASPSVAAVTFSTGFTSSSSYSCVATPNGNSAAIAAGGVAITYTSATVVTFTSANALSNAISFVCRGT
jgi:hypothetical protein